VPARSCDGLGACAPPAATNCGSYTCRAGACLDRCASQIDCVAGHSCNAGACATSAANGFICQSDAQCASNHCTDGVCCESACGGQCESCNANSPGVCVPVATAPVGLRPPCVGTGACQAQCDGVTRNACVNLPGPATSCVDACNGGVTVGYCNGFGSCTVRQGASCTALDGGVFHDGGVPDDASASDDGGPTIDTAVNTDAGATDASLDVRLTTSDGGAKPADAAQDRSPSTSPPDAGSDCQEAGCAPGLSCTPASKICVPAPSTDSSSGCSFEPTRSRSPNHALALLTVMALAGRLRKRHARRSRGAELS